MPGEISPVGGAGLKAADADREHALERLRAAAAEGRLTGAELDERVEVVLAARTLGALAAPLADLPAGDEAAAMFTQHGGRLVRTGSWRVPAVMRQSPSWCKVTLDFTEARINHPTLDLDLGMSGGALRLLTRPGIVVDADGLALHFAKSKLRPDATAWPADGSSPRLHIRLTGTLSFGKVIAKPARRGLGR